MSERHTGRCLCGAVTYAFTGDPTWCCYCHCESCRRGCSAPATVFFGVDDGNWSWTGEAPAVFRSSPGVRRYFCGACGSPMAFAADRFAGEIHFYLASLDDPGAYQPRYHVHHAERLSWLHLDDDLPRYAAGSERT